MYVDELVSYVVSCSGDNKRINFMKDIDHKVGDTVGLGRKTIWRQESATICRNNFREVCYGQWQADCTGLERD